MSRVRALFIGASLFVGVAAASAQTAPDGVVIDSDAHQVVLENEHVRVLHARRAAWKEKPDAFPSALPPRGHRECPRQVRLSDGKTQIFDINPGTVLWVDGVEHSWEILAGEVNGVAVEVKSAKAAKAAKAQ